MVFILIPTNPAITIRRTLISIPIPNKNSYTDFSNRWQTKLWEFSDEPPLLPPSPPFHRSILPLTPVSRERASTASQLFSESSSRISKQSGARRRNLVTRDTEFLRGNKLPAQRSLIRWDDLMRAATSSSLLPPSPRFHGFHSHPVRAVALTSMDAPRTRITFTG